MTSTTVSTIQTITDVKDYFANQNTPYYFIGATHFNLMNIEQWVNNWTHINFIDCFDGSNPSIMVPEKAGTPVFDSVEAINAFLLGHQDVVAKIQQEQQTEARSKAVFLFFDKELEEVCHSLDLDICLPENKLVKSIDNKITTTQIGNEAGVASVPNALEKVSSYVVLLRIAEEHHLGPKLVIQTAYGDSGKTTFFIASEADYDRVADQIEAEDKVKIMKHIRCAGTAIEGCATRTGTFVGPLLTELIGFPELTPYQGGWCGNELYQPAFSNNIRHKAHEMTEQLGQALYKRNYRGYFEVDYLIDLDSGEVYLGELNPRITGISAMTNMSDFCYKNVPLFLFHLLEYSGVNFTVEPTEYNQRSLVSGAQATAGQLIYKYTHQTLQIITKAPVSGIYKLISDEENQPELIFQKASYDRREALAEDEVFVMRIMQEAEYAYKGGDLAILFSNTPLKSPEENLTNTASALINALSNSFEYRELTEEEMLLVERYNSKASLKGSAASSPENAPENNEEKEE